MLTEIIALQPILRERAEQTKQLRKVPDESVQALQDIGFFLALQPKTYGGYELDPQDFFKMHCNVKSEQQKCELELNMV